MKQREVIDSHNKFEFSAQFLAEVTISDYLIFYLKSKIMLFQAKIVIFTEKS